MLQRNNIIGGSSIIAGIYIGRCIFVSSYSRAGKLDITKQQARSKANSDFVFFMCIPPMCEYFERSPKNGYSPLDPPPFALFFLPRPLLLNTSLYPI